jgi:hypothetical protein
MLIFLGKEKLERELKPLYWVVENNLGCLSKTRKWSNIVSTGILMI